MDPNILIVHRIEHHSWKTCPCSDCTLERSRQGHSPPPPFVDSRLRTISVKTAYTLGIIKKVNPHGSLARQIASEG